MKTHLSSSLQVTSKQFLDSIESNIIQIARSLALEYSIKVDPDAKKMTRELIQRKVNQLLSSEEKQNLSALWNETIEILKSNNNEKYARKVYEALKTARYDDV